MRLMFKATAGLPEYRGWHEGRFVHLKPGDAIEISGAAHVATLIKDYPANFAHDAAQAEDRALGRAPADRMIRKTRTK